MAEADNDRAVIGGNKPPIAEILTEEFADLIKRVQEIVDAAECVPAVDNQEVCEKAISYLGMIKAEEKKAEAKRKERKEEPLSECRAIDAFFAKMVDPLEPIYTKVYKQVQAFEAKRREEAAAEQARLDQAAAEQRALAERAAAAAKDLSTSTDAGERVEAIDHEIEANRRAINAENLERAADDIVAAAPLRGSHGGTAFAASKWKSEITDLTAAIKHARKVDEAAILACIQTIFDKQVRAGVRTFPEKAGVKAVEEKQLRIRT